MSHYLNTIPVTQAPNTRDIPATDLLMAEAMTSAYKDFSTSIYHELQTNRLSNFTFVVSYIFAVVLALIKREKHILRMFRAGKAYLISLLSEQISRNAHIDREHFDQTQRSCILRRFNQLPCTPKTLEFRVDLIAKYCSYSDPILVVGDDDLLSVALCKRGFSNVTAIDIDRKVLQQIANQTSGYPIKPKIIERDISLGLAGEHLNSFKLVVTDPPCTIEGLTLFLKAAVSALNPKNDSHLILCTHLLSQTEEGLRNLRTLIADSSLALKETLMATSVYPFPGELEALIRMLLRLCEFTVIRQSPRMLSKNTLNFFVSDTIILKRVSTL